MGVVSILSGDALSSGGYTAGKCEMVPQDRLVYGVGPTICPQLPTIYLP